MVGQGRRGDAPTLARGSVLQEYFDVSFGHSHSPGLPFDDLYYSFLGVWVDIEIHDGPFDESQ